MDIKIRDLDPMVIKKIDELAKKNKQSRQKFLKTQIENLSIINELQRQEDRFTLLVNRILIILKKNTDAFQNVNEVMGKMQSILLDIEDDNL